MSRISRIAKRLCAAGGRLESPIIYITGRPITENDIRRDIRKSYDKMPAFKQLPEVQQEAVVDNAAEEFFLSLLENARHRAGSRKRFSGDVLIATNTSFWAWEDDEDEVTAYLYDEGNGNLRLDVVKKHTSMGIGSPKDVQGRVIPRVSSSIVSQLNAGTVVSPRLSRVSSILKEHGHERSSAGGPFKRLWKDASKREAPLAKIILDYAATRQPLDLTNKGKIDLIVNELQGLSQQDLDKILKIVRKE